MKKIFFLIALFCELTCYSQIDTGSVRINGIVLKGRDTDAAASLIKDNPSSFQILDSVLKTKYIPNKPANGADVTIDGVPNKEWVRMYKAMSTNIICVRNNNGHFDRLNTELRLHGTAYIISRLDKELSRSNEDDNTMKKRGQNYASKTDETIDID